MKKIKLWGCGDCGSEHTEDEMITARLDNAEGFTCKYCDSKEPLEDLGMFDEKDLIKN